MTQIAEHTGIKQKHGASLIGFPGGKRFVERDQATGLYRLGLRSLQMAYLTLEHNDLRRLAAPFPAPPEPAVP